MPRRKATVDEFEEIPLPGADSLDPDPLPRAARGRPRKVAVKAAGNRGRIPARGTGGRILSKTAMHNKVRDEIELYLSLTVAGWELRDPICAASATPERIGAIADQITAMIARSDTLLETMSKSGILGNAVILLNALMPIAREVWAHHGPSGQGHRPDEGMMGDDIADRYPAYAG